MKLFFKKNIDYFVSMILIIIIFLLIATFLIKDEPNILSKITSYQFWNGLFSGPNSDLIYILSPVVITMGCTYFFYKKMHSGYFKNEITRIPYHRRMIKEIGKCYIKAILLFPAFFLIAFLVCCLFFPTTSFTTLVHLTPSLMVVCEVINVSLFSIAIVNIALIVLYFVKHFSLSVIATFLAVNIYHYLLANFIANEHWYYKFFEGFYVDFEEELFSVYIGSSVTIIITGIILGFLYYKKEKNILSEEKHN